MSYQYTNNASTTLASAITAASTTVTVSTGSGALFPVLSGGNVFRGTIVDAATQSLREIVQVTATAGDTFTITRGQEGTTPRAYNAGDIFYLDVTAAQYADYFSKTYDSFPPQSGRLVGVQVISSTGTYTPTSGTNSIIFWLAGAGGGGGGCASVDISHVSAGAGGSGGSVVIHRATSGFAGATVTIGLGGTGATGATGSNGGNSTFLGCTANGGLGGVSGPSVNSGFVTAGTNYSTATGGNIINLNSNPGQPGIAVGLSGCGGAGGGNFLASGNNTVSSGAGLVGASPGGGGSGAFNPPASSGTNPALAGGAGANGICVIYEYA